MKCDLIFVTLVYRNTHDPEDFLQSLKKLQCSYHVVMVNSYYDDESMNEAKALAARYGCDFVNVPNRGYGAGNNAGLKEALEKHEGRYIVISNPDIMIDELSLNEIEACGGAIVGPRVTARGGRNQNPLHYRRNLFVLLFRLLYAKIGFLPFYLGSIFFNKLEKAFYKRFYKPEQPRRVYALHGSFLILPAEALKKMGGSSLFDERMFLFCEENHIAELARKNGVRLIYDPQLKVLHKEDGSISLENHNHFKITRQSLQVFFKNWGILGSKHS